MKVKGYHYPIVAKTTIVLYWQGQGLLLFRKSISLSDLIEFTQYRMAFGGVTLGLMDVPSPDGCYSWYFVFVIIFYLKDNRWHQNSGGDKFRWYSLVSDQGDEKLTFFKND